MECPKCHAKLLWGYPTPESIKLIEEGKLIACGCASLWIRTTARSVVL